MIVQVAVRSRVATLNQPLRRPIQLPCFSRLLILMHEVLGKSKDCSMVSRCHLSLSCGIEVEEATTLELTSYWKLAAGRRRSCSASDVP